MTMPSWWTERRFGLFIHATVATVPGWAPIGEEASWYRSHLADAVTDTVVHPTPVVEVLAHHRDRWGHIEHYDDFVPLLSFENFDAEDWAQLARDAGAGYAIHVAKHHDGWAWWDAPNGRKLLTEAGPTRNVVAEFAAACERNDIVFGTSYSLLDWGDDRYPGEDYTDEVLHPQALDLVQRFGSAVLWADGEWAHDAGVWKTAEMMRILRDANPDLVINDRWWASQSDVPEGGPDIVRTFEVGVPDAITPGPWALTRAVGHSFGHNRAERSEHHMTGVEIVDVLTEVIAKGGHLNLAIGPAADGTIPEHQARPLREAGRWIRTHDALLNDSTPWTTWGDADVRYLRPSAGDDVVAIDVAGAGRFAALEESAFRVERVVAGDESSTVTWHQDSDGLHVTTHSESSEPDPIGIAVYRIDVQPVEQPDELFAPIEAAPTPIAPLLADASAGDIIQLGDASYIGPAHVPDGVTLRGLGTDRTEIASPNGTATIVPPGPVLTLGRDARVEHLTVTSSASAASTFARPLVEISADSGSILGCTVAGSILVDADDALVRAVAGQGLIATNADRLHVSRCEFAGNRWDVGIDLRSGGGHLVESNRLTNHLCAVRATATTGSTIRGNTVTARWWGVHVDHAEDSHVHGNQVRSTMRAVDIDGGTQAVVDGNAVTDGDSGCVVQDGAADCEVYGNHWDRCRIGLLAWEAGPLHHQDNTCSNLHDDSDYIVGPS